MTVSAQESGKVTLLVGDVTATSPDGTVGALDRGDQVEVGTIIKTGATGRAVVIMTDSSAIRIAANSIVTISLMDDQGGNGKSRVNIDITEGSVGALIDRARNRDIDFSIQTPQGVASARGTFYAVVVKDGETWTRVKHGRVALNPYGDEN